MGQSVDDRRSGAGTPACRLDTRVEALKEDSRRDTKYASQTHWGREFLIAGPLRRPITSGVKDPLPPLAGHENTRKSQGTRVAQAVSPAVTGCSSTRHWERAFCRDRPLNPAIGRALPTVPKPPHASEPPSRTVTSSILKTHGPLLHRVPHPESQAIPTVKLGFAGPPPTPMSSLTQSPPRSNSSEIPNSCRHRSPASTHPDGSGTTVTSAFGPWMGPGSP